MRFFLDFKSDNYGKKQVDEIFGTSDINFSLNQKEGGIGRDVSFSGGEIQFEFTHLRNHELKQLLYYHAKFGFEAIVELTIEIDDNNKYICDLDFSRAETDGLEYFNCKGIEDSKLQIVKARKSVKVDLLSSLDVDGNYINPLVPDNMLILAKPIVQTSKWENNNQIGVINSNFPAIAYNPCINLVNYDLEDSFTFFVDNRFYLSNEAENRSNFKMITAKDTKSNLIISIRGVEMTTSNSLELFLFYADKKISLKNITASTSFSGDIFYNIPILERGQELSIYFRALGNNIAKIKDITITAESTAYNSISPSIRLVDAIRQVVKSISGLSIDAPRFESLGQFFDNRLINGNFLRGITNKPFYLSLEDIEKSLPEMRGDWEIGSNGKIFFGIEQDYYTNIECGFFDNTQFSEMNKTFNPKYMINEFGFRYSNYQSQKENEEVNSADTIHGESKLVLFSKNIENKKEVEVQWTRDAFLIESTRRKALEITESTASQDDDVLFCIDTINTTFNYDFTEVTQLEHTFDVANYRVILRNNGSINFISLGIIVDSIFTIQPTDLNAGTYRVFSVTANSLELTRLVGVINSSGNGNRLTKYTYTLDQNSIPFTNYTNQGFTETSGLNAPDSYSNRRYSIARNIYNYWKSYLATANLYWKDKPLRNTWYKNNGDYTAKYNGIKLTEKADLIPNNPILSPVLYNDIVFANVEFSDFITLQNSIRSDRGFIRAIDNNDRVIKVYPVNMEYSLLDMELTIKGEEKYQQTYMTISTAFKYILINDETRVKSLLWEIKKEKLYIYDENRYRLYNGVFWFEVSINGAIPSSISELENWLSLVN